MGLAPFVHPDITHHVLKEGDRLILCSDGLWSVIEDEELPTLSEQAGEMSTLVNRLLYLAIDRGTDDNISAVGVHVHALAPEPQSAKPGWQWIRSIVRPF